MPTLPQLSGNFKITDANIHPHLQARMRQRGVTREEEYILPTVKARYGQGFRRK